MSDKYSLSSPSLLLSTYRQIGWAGRTVSCDNSIYGCTVRVDSLEERQTHKLECEHEPNAIIQCGECEIQLKRSELKYHNCIITMNSSLKHLRELINELEEKVNQQSIELNGVKQKLNQLQSTQHSTQHSIVSHSSLINGSTKDLNEKQFFFDLQNFNKIDNLNSREFPLNEKKAVSKESIPSNRIKVLPKVYTENQNSRKSYNEEEVDFGMYGSQKYKYLSQLSRDQNISPLIRSDSKSQSSEIDFTKKNKEKLVNVIKRSDNFNKKSPVVRMRSWSAREDDI